MEKCSENSRKSESVRLLTIFFLFFALGQSLFAHYYSRYVLTPVNEYVFEGEETVFETIIPNLKPSDILVTAQNLPEKVTFISSDTAEVFNDEGVRSTRVRIVYKFEGTGFFKMSPIASRIRYGAYSLNVADVTVLHNPQTIQPLVKLVPLGDEKVFYAGNRIKLMLTVEFAAKIESFYVGVLEDSAMVKTEEITALPLKIDSFTDEVFNIATFDFIPLTDGKINVPQIEVKVKTWKGAEKVISSQPLSFVVQKQTKNVSNKNLSNEQKLQSVSSEPSFYVEKENQNSMENATRVEGIQEETIRKIAELRKQERRKIFPHKIKKQRRQLENQLGIEKSEDEFYFTIIYFLLFLFFVSIVTLIVMIIHKKNQWIIVVGILTILLVTGISVCLGFANKEYCILLESKLYSIPEEDSSVYFVVKAGSRVLVKGETKNWILVSYGDSSSGWVKKDSLIFFH